MALRPAAFYAVSNSAHFLGLVGLLNSLRLAGHEEPLLVADCGLETWQRSLLEDHAEVAETEVGHAPNLAKWVLPRARPAEVIAHLDADLLVLRPLNRLLEAAAAGRVVVFADPLLNRFDPRWETLLGLQSLRRQTYVNSGVVVLPSKLIGPLFDAMLEGHATVDYARSHWGRGTPDYAFYYLDQDVLNAVLASLVAPTDLEIVDGSMAPHPPFAGVRLDGAGDATPYVLHHVDRKPWLAATRRNLYSDLLPRFLLADDVALRLDPRRVPLRLRTGALSTLERGRVEAMAILHDQRGKLGLRRWFGERLPTRSANA